MELLSQTSQACGFKVPTDLCAVFKCPKVCGFDCPPRVKNNRIPKIVNIDKSGANKAGIRDYNAKHGTKVVIRQCKYLNNIVEQDHRAVKRITRPIQGFKDFRSAGIILSGVELMHMIRKGQMRDDGRGLSAAQQFYMLAA